MPKGSGDTAEITSLLTEATPEAAARLQEIAETTPDKEIRKAAKRALYRLSLSGIAPPERAPQPVESQEPESDPLRAYASAFDGAGNRLLMVVLPDPDGGSPTLGQVLINDEEGVNSFDATRHPRREVTQRIERIEAQLEQGLALAEIEGDYGRWLLWEARLINQQRSRPTPGGFLDWLHRIGEPHAVYETSPVLTAFAPDAIRSNLSFSHDPAALFALPWFEPWYFAIGDVVRWLEAWDQVEGGRIEVSETTKEERRERIVTEATTALLTPEMRARYIRRLEESADILRRRDKEEAARMALYHALALADNGTVTNVPFARALVRRTLEAAHAAVNEQRQRRAAGTPAVG